MPSFFHGWKPKLGAVTLMMACFATIAWYRSVDSCDWIEIPITRQYSWLIHSSDSDLYIFQMLSTHEDPESTSFDHLMLLGYLLADYDHDTMNLDDGRSIVSFPYGFYSMICAEYDFFGGVIPYWPIVVSLSLFSSFLLKPKRRQSESDSNDRRGSQLSVTEICHFLQKRIARGFES